MGVIIPLTHPTARAAAPPPLAWSLVSGSSLRAWSDPYVLQDGHCPSHCACPSPHFSHTYTVLAFLVLLFLNLFCPLGCWVAWIDTSCLLLLDKWLHVAFVSLPPLHGFRAIHRIRFQHPFPTHQLRISLSFHFHPHLRLDRYDVYLVALSLPIPPRWSSFPRRWHDGTIRSPVASTSRVRHVYRIVPLVGWMSFVGWVRVSKWKSRARVPMVCVDGCNRLVFGSTTTATTTWMGWWMAEGHVHLSLSSSTSIPWHPSEAPSGPSAKPTGKAPPSTPI